MKNRPYNIWDIFDRDLSSFMHCGFDLPMIQGERAGVKFSVDLRAVMSFESNSKFAAYKLPDDFDIVSGGPYLIDKAEDHINTIISGVEVHSGSLEQRPQKSTSLVFSKQVYFYIDAAVDGQAKNAAYQYGLSKGMHVEVRDQEYASFKASLIQPMGFICHAWADKERVARPLALHLHKSLTPVWYDEFSLRIGDSLLDSINHGVRTSGMCILILSKTFFSNTAYASHEFHSFFSKEMMVGAPIFLPVWVDVEASEVFEFAPFLKDRVAEIWADDQIGTIANSISSRLREAMNARASWQLMEKVRGD